MDEIGLLDYGYVSARDFGTRRVQPRRLARWNPDRGALPGRSRCPANRPRVRAGDRFRPQAAGPRVNCFRYGHRVDSDQPHLDADGPTLARFALSSSSLGTTCSSEYSHVGSEPGPRML